MNICQKFGFVDYVLKTMPPDDIYGEHKQEPISLNSLPLT